MTAGGVDFHSHILPGIDDGSASAEESVAMLRMEAQQGIGRVVATPHFYPRYETPEQFLQKRELAEAQLREVMAEHTDLPELLVGAEVYFFPGMSESDFLPQLTIGQTRCILVEMPHAPWNRSVYRELASIWEKRDLIPVIAHIDRYIRPFHTYGIPDRLEELPVFVQANGEFFLDRSTASMALRMLKKDRIQLLGSDCHNTSDRVPNLDAARRVIARKLGQEALERIASYEAQLLDD